MRTRKLYDQLKSTQDRSRLSSAREIIEEFPPTTTSDLTNRS
jgi:hypothetical protein